MVPDFSIPPIGNVNYSDRIVAVHKDPFHRFSAGPGISLARQDGPVCTDFGAASFYFYSAAFHARTFLGFPVLLAVLAQECFIDDGLPAPLVPETAIRFAGTRGISCSRALTVVSASPAFASFTDLDQRSWTVFQ